jgi:hypothetical protein
MALYECICAIEVARNSKEDVLGQPRSSRVVGKVWLSGSRGQWQQCPKFSAVTLRLVF